MEDNTTAYVTVDGTYGEDDIILFHPSALTLDQWEFMTNVQASDRLPYVRAVLEKDNDTVQSLYAEYGYLRDYMPDLDWVEQGDPHDTESMDTAKNMHREDY